MTSPSPIRQAVPRDDAPREDTLRGTAARRSSATDGSTRGSLVIASRPFLHGRVWLIVLLIAIVAGLLHRQAAADPWADDRILVLEPSWFQMAAPRLHAAVPDAASIAAAVIRVIDPLSRASTAGDIRALAACAAGLSAGGLLLLLARLGVPLWIAAPLALSGVGLVLPASTATSLTHALQMLIGVSLLLIGLGALLRLAGDHDSDNNGGDSWRRLAMLIALTIAGTLNHASFLAFAAIVWIAVCYVQPVRASRVRVLISGVATLAVSLALAPWLVHLNAAGPIGVDLTLAGGRPGTLAIAAALLTGRFAAAAQPTGSMSAMSAIGYVLPAPAILAVPLAAAAFLRERDARWSAAACALAAAALGIFVAGTWLPDPAIAAAPAKLATIAVAGVGLSWLAAQTLRGARPLAIVAAIVLGLYGFTDTARWGVPLQTARLQAFVESVTDATAAHGGRMRWVSERLAIDRALLLSSDSIWAASRVPAQRGLLRAIADDHAVFVFSEARARFGRDEGWIRSVDLPYPSAASFLAAQVENWWIAIASGDDPASAAPFLRDLAARLHADAGRGDNDSMARLAGLGRIGGDGSGDAVLQRDRLDRTYNQLLGDSSGSAPGSPGSPTSNAQWPVPARFAIEATPAARITINGELAAKTPTDTRQGVALVLFDPWRMRYEDWILGLTPDTSRPTIRDTRLQAACLVAESLGPELTRSRPRLPLLASIPIRVPLAATDVDWFGAGWQGPETDGVTVFRWTNAADAHLRVLVSHRQAIRVRLRGGLAEAPGNGLGVSWNGTVVAAPGPWRGEGTFVIPADVVRRGLNDLAVRVSHLAAPGLGAAINEIVLEPVVTVPSR